MHRVQFASAADDFNCEYPSTHFNVCAPVSGRLPPSPSSYERGTRVVLGGRELHPYSHHTTIPQYQEKRPYPLLHYHKIPQYYIQTHFWPKVGTVCQGDEGKSAVRRRTSSIHRRTAATRHPDTALWHGMGMGMGMIYHLSLTSLFPRRCPLFCCTFPAAQGIFYKGPFLRSSSAVPGGERILAIRLDSCFECSMGRCDPFFGGEDGVVVVV